jgi:GNAT superfamily N-acetyltransferase
MGIEYRPARSDDLPEVATVFATAIDDLDRKHGFFEKPTPTSPRNPQYAFWLKKDPASFWVAEDNHSIVGYSYSFVRGSLWYLADLFILPRLQGKGIGRTLIQRTLASWKGHRIVNRALITPAFNPASVSLYMRFGMLPRQPVYFASAPKESVARTLESRRSVSLEVEDVADFEVASPKLSEIHILALGFPSGWHNEFFSEVQKARCLLFRRNNRPEGYAFLRRNGRIGPLVMKSESSFGPALEATLRAAAEEDGDELTIFFAGTNEEAALASIKHGFRITYPNLFLSAKPMGGWNNYLFYSPGLM